MLNNLFLLNGPVCVFGPFIALAVALVVTLGLMLIKVFLNYAAHVHVTHCSPESGQDQDGESPGADAIGSGSSCKRG